MRDPTVGQCLGPYGGPRGVAFSYERGTPACDAKPLATVEWTAQGLPLKNLQRMDHAEVATQRTTGITFEPKLDPVVCSGNRSRQPAFRELTGLRSL